MRQFSFKEDQYVNLMSDFDRVCCGYCFMKLICWHIDDGLHYFDELRQAFLLNFISALSPNDNEKTYLNMYHSFASKYEWNFRMIDTIVFFIN